MPAGIARIEICGGIASGKTTLAKLLSGPDIVGVFEEFLKNPFYRAFYRDPVGSAFETELTFLLQHYHQEKLSLNKKLPICADFSIVLDHAYACVTLTPAKLKIFRSVHRWIENELPGRSLLIHLQCPPQVELRRIKRRQRRTEQGITLAYLSKINHALDVRTRCLARAEKVLVIDSDSLDFASDPRAKAHVRHQVAQALNHDRETNGDRVTNTQMVPHSEE